ncbi:hypothetical protein BX616_001696, partial [Lobosporangium transversale]
ILSPSKALKLFNIYIEDVRRIDHDDDDNIVLEICLDAVTTLSRIHRSVRKTLVSSTRDEDKALCQRVATAYRKLGRSFERLGHLDGTRCCERKAGKWGYTQENIVLQGSPSLVGSIYSYSSNNSNSNSNLSIYSKQGRRYTNTRMNVIEEVEATAYSVAVIPDKIFEYDIAPTIIRYSLPDLDEHFDDVVQLVYCLKLLPTALNPITDLNDHEQQWVLAISNDHDEQERLRNLVSDMIAMFISDGIKAEATVAEVVSLAPVLNPNQFRTVLMALTNGISQNILLDTHLLEGLAQLMQCAPPGYLDSDDLVKILDILSTRLKKTHNQSGNHLYRLSTTISHVLDAMVTNQVKGLRREQLHEPLSVYLKELKSSSDPYLIYHAAYAFQALEYIPDDETPIQAMLRRTTVVFHGVFGAVSAVKNVDMNAFVNELGHIQRKLPSVNDVINTSLRLYKGATSIHGDGETFLECMQEGCSFSRKTAWYPALRGIDSFIQAKELAKLKTLVCEVPCRRDPAFQWGLCQRLGQLATDTKWTMDVRQGAVAFLGEIYRNDNDWGHHVHIKQWILTILKRLVSSSENGPQIAAPLLRELAGDGDTNKQWFYSNCLQSPEHQYPLIISLPSPASPSLLDRVQNKPDVENSLRQLRRQRMKDRDDRSFYIPQYAKASPQAQNEDLFLLMDKAKEFLDSDQKVLLVQGDSGIGKSTFNRALERSLWEVYRKKHGRIPLYINLAAIDSPEGDLVAKQLRKYDFSEPQIKELKTARSLILICDGYDESKQTSNLYVTNRLNQPGEWKSQMVINCRSEYLGSDYRDRFQPVDRNYQTDTALFAEAMIVPFNESQIDDYVEQYVAAMDPLWPVENYKRALKMVPSLHELVKNPFLLTLSLEVLPRMVDPSQDATNTQIKRISLYDQFVEQWLERGKKRLGETLEPGDRKMFLTLSDEGFAENGIRYLADLATAIYKHQDGNPVVNYSPFKHRGTWKEEYFSRESGRYLLREASPLSRTGIQHRFIHRSLLEYSLARAIFEPRRVMNALTKGEEATATPSSRRQSVSSEFSFEVKESEMIEEGVDSAIPDEASPLVWRSLVGEPSILQFLEDRVRLEPVFKQQLYDYVELSKNDSKWRIAASNAMTILIKAGETFIEADLRGIQIPGADLSHGIFECAQLQGADLRKTNLRNCWLREADLSDAKMDGVQFGEWPLLCESDLVWNGSYSPDGRTLAAAIDDGSINVYNTSTWEKVLTLKGYEVAYQLVYSPDSRHIASRNDKHSVGIWDTTSGTLIHNLESHTQIVSHMVYSPNGYQFASAGEELVQVWDLQTGELQYTLEGHSGGVWSLTYSPDGKQIATSANDKMIRLWDAISGQQTLVLHVDQERVTQAIYSPSGQEIIFRCDRSPLLYAWDVVSGQKKWTLKHDGDIKGIQCSPRGKLAASFTRKKAYQWNIQTGKVINTLKGNSNIINDLKYSPNGEQIATCSLDYTVRLWDALSGQHTNTLYGHSKEVYRVSYSPINHQLASFSRDKTIRLWDTQSRQSSHDSHGHTKSITSVRCSPDGQHIASSSLDGTVRVWDIQTGRPIHVLQSHAEAAHDVKYSYDGLLLASCHNTPRVHLWDTQSGQVFYTLEWQRKQDDVILTIDFSPIGHLIVCGHYHGDVSVWNTQTRQLIGILQGHSTIVRRVVFSPNGRQIASSDNVGRTKVWAAHSGELMYELEDVFESSMIYSPDSQKNAFLNHRTGLRVQNTEKGELCFETKFDDYQHWIAFSPSDPQMIVGSQQGSINVVDTESGAVLHTLEGHTEGISAAAYTPDGRYIATSSDDMTVRLWDPRSFRCLAVAPHPGGYPQTLAWNVSEEGYFLVAGSQDASVRMWQVIKEGDRCHYRLKWNTRQTVLYAGSARIQSVAGLSEVERKLLVERGAVDGPAQCPTSQEASNEIMTMASVISKSEVLPNRANLESLTIGSEAKACSCREPTRLSELISQYRLTNITCKDCDVVPMIVCGCTSPKMKLENK